MSTHKKNMSVQTGATKDSDLKVSVEKNSSLSTKNFWVLEYSIENTGSEYKRYDKINITIDKAIENEVKVVVGQDLVNWAEGIKNKIEKDNYNLNLFLGSMSTIAASSAAISKDPQYSKAAMTVAAAGYGTLAVNQFIQIRDGIKNTNKSDTRGLIPGNHVLATPVSVPPNLFLKRFAVFYIPNKMSAAFYKTSMSFEGGKKTLNVAMDARFGPHPITNKCKPNSPTMRMNRLTIHCLADCKRMHPTNRKSCRTRYTKKFLR